MTCLYCFDSLIGFGQNQILVLGHAVFGSTDRVEGLAPTPLSWWVHYADVLASRSTFSCLWILLDCIHPSGARKLMTHYF